MKKPVHILEMSTRELLDFLCNQSGVVRDSAHIQTLIATSIIRHQDNLKRATDLLTAIKENS